MTTTQGTLKAGQVWERGDGSAVRIQGFCKDGWVKVREIGGDRDRSSYPPAAFRNGVFTLPEGSA